MEYPKSYYKAIKDVIEFIAQGNNHVTCEMGEELSGNYWPDIVNLFRNARACVVECGGNIFITQGQYLNPIYENCLHAIKMIEEEESDRRLSNLEKEENIKYGRKGYRISLIAIILSSLAILVEIWLALR